MSEYKTAKIARLSVATACALTLVVMVSGTISALTINLNYDPDSTFTAAGLSAADIVNMKAANAYVVSQLTSNFNDNINVNIRVTAVPGTSTLGQSSTFLVSTSFANLRTRTIADATTADDATATGGSGSVPAVDPVVGSHTYFVSRAQAKALAIIADNLSQDGTYTFGGGFSYTYDPQNRAVPGKFDYIGVSMHEFTEIMGRIGLMGEDVGVGSPSYMQMDLFHYTGANTRGLNNGAGRLFSIDNGTTLLKGFNNGAANGGDLQDWASGTNDSFNAFSSSGVQNDLTPVDLRVMDVIGYNLMTSTTRTLTVATSNPNSGVSIQVSPNDNNGAGDGVTQFTRIYNNNTAVSLTAPSTANGNTFQKWQRDGSDWDMNTLTSVTMDANHTMTAIYSGSPPPTAQLLSPTAGAVITFPQTFSWTLSDNSAVTVYFAKTSNPQFGVDPVVIFADTVSGSGHISLTAERWADAVAILGSAPTYYWSVGNADDLNPIVYASWRQFTAPVVHISQPDFNGDGKVDYALYNSTTHQTALWYLNNNVRVGATFGPTLPAGWQLIDVADFNGDKAPDYVLFNPATRQTQIWYISGGAHTGDVVGPTIAGGYSLLAVADFDRDGNPDYLLYSSATRRTAIWYLNGNQYHSAAYGPVLASGYNLAGVADFNGDGKLDFALFNPSARKSAIWYLSGPAYASAAYGPTITSGYELVGTADFDGDGKPDFALYNPTSRQTAIWYLNNNILTSGQFGPGLPAGYILAAP